LNKGGDVEQFEKDFRQTVLSLRAMTGEDLRVVNSQKLKVVMANPGDTYAELAKKVPLKSYAEETLRLLNGDHPRGEPRAGDLIKIIQ
ncbi:MAG: putative Zn-dependent protease, partial [Candidatus Azotimanducaceae bacterium]